MKRTVIFLLIFLAVIAIASGLKFWSTASEGNTIIMRNVPSSATLGGKPAVEVEVTSQRTFPANDPNAILQIGKDLFHVSQFKNGDPHTLIFTLTPTEFDKTRNESPIIVRYASDAAGRWDFGFLEKKWITNSR